MKQHITHMVLYVVVGALALPTVALGGSFTYSLIQGKTPSEAVDIIANQLDTLTGRVSQLETDKDKTAADIEALKQENATLIEKVAAMEEAPKTSAPVVAAATAIQSSEGKTCNDLVRQMNSLEQSALAQFNPKQQQIQQKAQDIRSEISSLEHQYEEQLAEAKNEKPKQYAGTDGVGAQIDSDIKQYQDTLSKVSELRATFTSKINAKQKEIDSLQSAIQPDVDKTLEELHSSPAYKKLKDEATDKSCA